MRHRPPQRISSFLLAAFSGLLSACHDDRADVDPTPITEFRSSPPSTSGTHLEFETPFPHTGEFPIHQVERNLVTRYLDDPADPAHAAALVQWNLDQTTRDSCDPGTALARTIIATYFLHRQRDLGDWSPALEDTLADLTAQLEDDLHAPSPAAGDEQRYAHVVFRKAFHLGQEHRRYEALGALLNAALDAPNDVYTSFLLTASNLWIGGEARHDDPSMLYNFVLGSYFSVRTMSMAAELERAWEVNPQHVQRFRLASILGAFSILQRRWLASVHGDSAAISALDAEHREWIDVHLAFHGFTYGLVFYDTTDQSRFFEAFGEYVATLGFCEAVPVRTCSDLPRLPYNLLSFQLGLIDWLLKAGDLEAAQDLFAFRHLTEVPTTYGGPSNQVERWQQWHIGRDAWLHRERNAEALVARYQQHPEDAPTNFLLSKKRWGTSTFTCQQCHQSQGRPVDMIEFDTFILPPEEIASVGIWPTVSTTWYGSST